MNVRSGTLIDIELLRDEFTAAIEPPFRKGNQEFETGEGATNLSNPLAPVTAANRKGAADVSKEKGRTLGC